MPNANDTEAASLMSIQSVKPTPDTLTKLVKRLRALTLTLLPVEVDPETLNDPTSRVITLQVISAYRAAAGDFAEALPYCLLRARAEFIWDANHNNADYGENYGRAIACEVLARRVVHSSPPERISALMSTRFRHRQMDGDSSDMTSALEMAIDSHCTIFLSSTEAQDVVGCLWRGELIQQNNDNLDIDCRYQNFLRILVWLVLLVVYSQTVKQPAERLDPLNSRFLDVWEVVFYTLGLSITIEDVYKFYKLINFVTWRAFSFWNIVSLVTDSLMASAFALRIAGMYVDNEQRTIELRIASFQVLSFVSPFIWMKLVTVFDGYKYIGTMQICIARMLQESGIFFALLSLMAIGFAQALYALDAADGQADPPSGIANVLIQALLQAPDFAKFNNSPSGMVMYYFWNIVTALILLNVLISLFSSAYSDVVDDAEAQYLAFFAGKTIGMIRAPDSYVYPAPFNLIEIVFVSPFELVPGFRLKKKSYANLNRFVMRILFCVPLAIIAMYESASSSTQHAWVTNWMRGVDEGDENYPESRDPAVEGEEDAGLEISKVPFIELIKVFPNTAQSSEALILSEISELKNQLAAVLQKLDGQNAVKG